MICTFSLQFSRRLSRDPSWPIFEILLGQYNRPRPELQCTSCLRPLPLPRRRVGGGREGEGGEVTFRGFGSQQQQQQRDQGLLQASQPGFTPRSPPPFRARRALPALHQPFQPSCCTSAPSFNPSPPPAEPPSYIPFILLHLKCNQPPMSLLIISDQQCEN